MSKESQIHTNTASVTVHKYIHERHISSDMFIAYAIWQSGSLLQFAMSNINLLHVGIIAQIMVLYVSLNQSFIHSFMYLHIYIYIYGLNTFHLLKLHTVEQ